MVVVVMMVLVLMLGRGRSLAGEVGLFVLVKMVGVENLLKRHSSEKLAEYIHGVFENEVEVSLACERKVGERKCVNDQTGLKDFRHQRRSGDLLEYLYLNRIRMA